MGSYLRRLMLCLCREIRDRAGVEEIRISGASEGKYKQVSRRRESAMVQGSER